MMTLVFFVLLGTGAAAEVARPSNLLLEGVEAGTPQECVTFFSETGWEGSWDNQRPHELWVEKIRSNCTAQVVYSYGVRPGKNDTPSYIRVSNAEIKGGFLTFNLPSSTARITVTYKLVDGKMTGEWKSDQSSYPPSTISLIKRK